MIPNIDFTIIVQITKKDGIREHESLGSGL